MFTAKTVARGRPGGGPSPTQVATMGPKLTEGNGADRWTHGGQNQSWSRCHFEPTEVRPPFAVFVNVTRGRPKALTQSRPDPLSSVTMIADYADEALGTRARLRGRRWGWRRGSAVI